MSKDPLKTSRVIMPAIVSCVLIIGWSNKPVYAQCCASHQQGGHANNQASDHSIHQSSGLSIYQAPLPSDYQAGHTSHQHATPGVRTAAYAPVAQQAPHGGQITGASPFTFEVVYQPQEIRLYVYGPNPQPVAIRDIKGEITLRVRSAAKASQAPLQYVAQPAGSSQPDYLAARLDLSKFNNGDATVSFKLDNLPDANRAKAAFTQTFALTKVKAKVTLAQTSEADRAGIAQQKVCPVTGAQLGSMGAPVKVLVGAQSLYLCCQGCVAKVKNAPETYLSKVAQSHQSQ